MKKPLIPALFVSFSAITAFAGSPIVQSPPPNAERAEESWLDGDYFFGTWGGLRTRLADSGVKFDGYYVTNPAGNPWGGKKEGGFTYSDNFYLGVTFDLEKLIGWNGATLLVSGINRDGNSLTTQYVGSQYVVQQIVGGQNIFFYDLCLEQRFWDDKFKLKIGRFGASDDFNTSPIYGLYMNNGIDGNIRNVLFDTQFSAYPFATWAARLRYDPTPEINAQFGVFQTWSEIFNRTHNGLNWDIRHEDGVFLIAQVGWTPELFKRPVPTAAPHDAKTIVQPEMRGLPGHYWIGGSLSPWHGYSQFGKLEKTGNSYGFYVHADQMVYQEAPGSDQGLTLFVASGYYPQDNISIIPFQINVGGFYTGLIPGRERDKTIFGLIYGKFGDDYARTFELTGIHKPTREVVAEFAHRIQLTKFAYIQPDIQFISRPGGTGTIDDAWVLGAQVGVTF